jgi:hypothetical protein
MPCSDPFVNAHGHQVFDDAFDQFSFWLMTQLKRGDVMAMGTMEIEYRRIRGIWNEPITEGVLRTASIRSIVIQSNETDVILLSIAHVWSLFVDNLTIKSTNTRTKTDIYVDVR